MINRQTVGCTPTGRNKREGMILIGVRGEVACPLLNHRLPPETRGRRGAQGKKKKKQTSASTTQQHRQVRGSRKEEGRCRGKGAPGTGGSYVSASRHKIGGGKRGTTQYFVVKKRHAASVRGGGARNRWSPLTGTHARDENPRGRG